MSETSVKRGPVSGLGRIRRGDTDLFGGAFTIRTGYELHSGRSGSTVSVGPEPIMEIPVKSVGSGSGSREGEKHGSTEFPTKRPPFSVVSAYATRVCGAEYQLLHQRRSDGPKRFCDSQC